MANFRTHTIDGGLGGSYLILKDMTPDSLYIENGVDIINDTFILGELIITDSEEVQHTVQFDYSDFLDSRGLSGLKIDSSDFSPSLPSIADGRYTSVYNTSFSQNGGETTDEYLSELDSVLYGNTTASVIQLIMDSNWKTSYGDRTANSSNSIKVKSWYDSVVMANNTGLISEAERILIALQRIL